MSDYYDDEDLPYEDDKGYPFDEDDYRISDVFGDIHQAREVYDSMADNWKGDGFSASDMFDMIHTIDNTWYDEEGNIHGEYYWESPDGRYYGHGSF
jgi:hypothetical protein